MTVEGCFDVGVAAETDGGVDVVLHGCERGRTVRRDHPSRRRSQSTVRLGTTVTSHVATLPTRADRSEYCLRRVKSPAESAWQTVEKKSMTSS